MHLVMCLYIQECHPTVHTTNKEKILLLLFSYNCQWCLALMQKHKLSIHIKLQRSRFGLVQLRQCGHWQWHAYPYVMYLLNLIVENISKGLIYSRNKSPKIKPSPPPHKHTYLLYTSIQYIIQGEEVSQNNVH